MRGSEFFRLTSKEIPEVNESTTVPQPGVHARKVREETERLHSDGEVRRVLGRALLLHIPQEGWIYPSTGPKVLN